MKGGGGLGCVAQQPGELRGARNRGTGRSQRLRHQPAHQSNPPQEAILISGTSNMVFQALATVTIPDLANIGGSRQTRALPRQRR